MSSAPPTPPRSPWAAAERWAYRLSLATALATIPLILFGGSVTTLGAGMAVEGWLDAEGHFMVFFPIEKWFRDRATIVEHTHRLFGTLVGLFAIATVLAGWRSKQLRWPLIGLVAVCAQGTLGGFRVLENSPQLAFLHGALAQAVFALLCVVALVLSPWWRSAREFPAVAGSALTRSAWVAAGLVYTQIVLGAWYRHGLRTGESGIAVRLALHFLGAFAVFLAVLAVARRVRRATADWRGEFDLGPLRRAGKRAAHLLALQVLLGLFAWAAHTGAEVGLVEWTLSVLHVLTGGLLLAQCCLLGFMTRPVPHLEKTFQPQETAGVTA